MAKKNWRKQEAVGPFVVECQHKLTGIKSYLAKGGGVVESADNALEFPTHRHADSAVIGNKNREHEFCVMPHPLRERYPAPVWEAVKALVLGGIPIAEVNVSEDPDQFDHEVVVAPRMFVQVPTDGSPPHYAEHSAENGKLFLYIFEPTDLAATIKDRLPKEAQ